MSMAMPYFRDLLIAAPLKLGCTHDRHHGGALFPRSADRGPIEATVPCGFAGSVHAFPRSADRSPIEANSRSRWRSSLRDFRDLLIAAPLKLKAPCSPRT